MCDPSTKHAKAIPDGSLKFHYNSGISGFVKGAFAVISTSRGAALLYTHDSREGALDSKDIKIYVKYISWLQHYHYLLTLRKHII